MMKKFGRCGEEKSTLEFNLDSNTHSGYACYCRACTKIKNSESYKKCSEDFDWKLKQTLRASKNRAKAKELEHTLTLDDLKELYPADNKCPVFGFELSWGNPKWSSPSLDRIDSSKGYTYDNCQIISNKANVIKNDATLEDLELLVSYLKENGFE